MNKIDTVAMQKLKNMLEPCSLVYFIQNTLHYIADSEMYGCSVNKCRFNYTIHEMAQKLLDQFTIFPCDKLKQFPNLIVHHGVTLC